ncbi:MAG: hypothetical protein GY722_10230 [bacterium]|nr:hypothetical protein [bacterium]
MDSVSAQAQASPTGGNIEDGRRHTMRVVWNAERNEFDVYFEGSERLLCSRDIVNTVFGGDGERPAV